MGNSNYVHLENCSIVRESEKAFLIRHRQKEHWIPKSQIADADDLREGDDEVTVSITEWIAGEKGIEPDDE